MLTKTYDISIVEGSKTSIYLANNIWALGF